jgi:hypothetical protein
MDSEVLAVRLSSGSGRGVRAKRRGEVDVRSSRCVVRDQVPSRNRERRNVVSVFRYWVRQRDSLIDREPSPAFVRATLPSALSGLRQSSCGQPVTLCVPCGNRLKQPFAS